MGDLFFKWRIQERFDFSLYFNSNWFRISWNISFFYCKKKYKFLNKNSYNNIPLIIELDIRGWDYEKNNYCKVFFSFHYKPDNWRASQIRNIGMIEGNSPVADNKWEEIKRGGEQAIKRWIDTQLKGEPCERGG